MNPVVNFSVDGSAVAAAPHRGGARATAITATSRFRCTAACATTRSTACCATIRRIPMPSHARHGHGRGRQSAASAGHQLQSAGSPHSRRRECRRRRRQESLHRGGLRGKPQRLLRRPLPGHESRGRRHLSAKLLACATSMAAEQNLPLIGLNPVTDPQGWINPVPGHFFGLQRMSCFEARSGALPGEYTDSLGESCTVCHAAGAQFAVDAVHAQ